MPRTASEEDNKRIIMDLDVIVKSYNFPYIVRCLGYFVRTVSAQAKDGWSSRYVLILVRSVDMYGIDGDLFR